MHVEIWDLCAKADPSQIKLACVWTHVMHMCAGCWAGKAGLAAPEARTIAAVHVAKKKASEVQRVGMCIMETVELAGSSFVSASTGKKRAPNYPLEPVIGRICVLMFFLPGEIPVRPVRNPLGGRYRPLEPVRANLRFLCVFSVGAVSFRRNPKNFPPDPLGTCWARMESVRTPLGTCETR